MLSSCSSGKTIPEFVIVNEAINNRIFSDKVLLKKSLPSMKIKNQVIRAVEKVQGCRTSLLCRMLLVYSFYLYITQKKLLSGCGLCLNNIYGGLIFQ